MTFKDFEKIGINPDLLSAVETMGFVSPTPVQEQTIPVATSRCDVIVQAPTGTGKTFAFAIPILNMVNADSKCVQALILSPTRELTLQIASEMKKLASKIDGLIITSVYGGQNIDRQFAELRKKPQVVIGTTGRIMDHIRRKTLKLDNVKYLVLDEADEMLNMGFREDIDYILKSINGDVQTLLFSATIPKEIKEISAQYQRNPISIKTTCEGMNLPAIKQYVVRVREDTKFDILKRIVSAEKYKTVLIFCNTKLRASELNDKLNNEYYLSAVLHGDLRQRERDKVMRSFRDHAINILVATDIAARGIDVEGIEAIFNYDIPIDEEFYVHRIGRTARANRSGIAYTFCTGRDKARFSACEKIADCKMNEYQIEGLTENIRATKIAYPVPTVRYFINVGEKDGATDENIRDYFIASTSMCGKDIFDVKLHDIYGFIEVDEKFNNEIIGLIGQKCFKRKLAIEISMPRGQKKGSKQLSKNKNMKKSYSEGNSPKIREKTQSDNKTGTKKSDNVGKSVNNKNYSNKAKAKIDFKNKKNTIKSNKSKRRY